MRGLMTSSTTRGRLVLMDGTQVDLPDAVATRLIGRGRAVPVREPEIERAVTAAPEHAVTRRKRHKGRRNVEQN
jgi:hypothetical protein